MQNRWNAEEAACFAGELAQCVYASRLLGQDKALVLHGGGNTSVKVQLPTIFGELEDIVYVKGSGIDLAAIEAKDFTPVRLAHLRRLVTLDALSDLQWLSELRSSVSVAAAPPVSVEAMLHALLPAQFVLHTHPDALLSISNTPSGAERIRALYGDEVVVVPYVRPGFPLAKRSAAVFEAELSEQTRGVLLWRHGLFTFGATVQAAYDMHIALVTRAEEYLQAHNAWHIAVPPLAEEAPRPLRRELAALRREVSIAATTPMLLATHDDAASRAFVRRPDLPGIALQGPATPDHVIRTKRLPLIGRDVTAYATAYADYFGTYALETSDPLTMLDPAPRIILDPDLGMLTIGRSAREAGIAADMYRQTMEIIQRASALEAWEALPAGDIFEVEYWALEQAKLRHQDAAPPFAGEVALVTGAASGIGKACVEALRRRGAAVLALDINPAVAETFPFPDVCGVACDITDEAALIAALETGVRAFGGLDMLVLNAGIFPGGRKIDALGLAEWERVMRVNLDANLALLREAHPLLKLAPRGGRVAVIGSRNVPAPGPGAAAYSASKAALTQLARVAALEWGTDGIRINILHPHAVFDTGIWTDEVLRQRAASYGLSVEQYKTNNVLRVEVTSRDVAELAAELCGPLFAKITGAQIPIDGGNERVI